MEHVGGPGHIEHGADAFVDDGPSDRQVHLGCRLAARTVCDVTDGNAGQNGDCSAVWRAEAARPGSVSDELVVDELEVDAIGRCVCDHEQDPRW